jgi:hypothetical protein
MATTAPRLSFTARDLVTIRTELENVIKETRPTEWSDFFQSNLGVSIIELNALIGDMISYGLDAGAGEFFLSTMRRYESALRFARSVGYVPRSHAPASVIVVADPLPETLTTNGGTVPAGSAIELDDLRFELLEEVTIAPSDTDSTLTLSEVTSYEETFDPSSQPGQEVETANGVVADASWDVFVGDASNPDNEWVQVDKVAFETSATEVYEIFFDGDGKLHVVFGDGAAGKIPDDTITIQYRTTRGKDGDRPLLAVSGAIKVNIAGGIGTVAVTYQNSTGASSGGSDREDLDELKVNIPAYISTLDKALTLLDFERTALTISDVALAYADILLASYVANVVRVHMWEEETYDFVGETEDESVSSTKEYGRYAQMPESRIGEVQTYLAARTPTNIHTVIERPDMAFADVYLGDVRYDQRYTKEVIHAAITAAVVKVFEDSTGFTVRVAELYNAIRDTAGVLYFYLERVVFSHLILSAATGTVTLTGLPTDTDTITIDDGTTTKTFEFDDDDTVTGGNVPVPILGTAALTLENLRIAINSNLDIVAVTDDEAGDPTLDLTNNTPGTDGNRTITKAEAGAVITVTGMLGGLDTPETEIIDYRRDQDPETDRWPSGAATAATGWVKFPGAVNPSDGETVVIGDGLTTETFEFESGGGVGGGNIAVTIGGSAAATLANLETAIEANLEITGTIDAGVTDPNLDLLNDNTGVDGNVEITTTGADILVSGMTGGAEGAAYDESTPASGEIVLVGTPLDGDTVTIGDGTDSKVFEFDDNASITGDVAVEIGPTDEDTRDNLEAAIEANLNITATANLGATDPTVDLEHDTAGSVGNVTMTESTSEARITVSGMSGGGTGGTYFRDGGVLPYYPIENLQIPGVASARRFYDETYLYNNEIYYDSGVASASLVQAINLRRLTMNLVATAP